MLEFLQSAKAYTPQPLLKQSLSTDEWEALEKHSNDMYNDFQERASVLIKRLEVTVESFFWSERVKKLEPEVKAVYEPLKAGLPLPHRVYPEDVISASTGCFIILILVLSSAVNNNVFGYLLAGLFSYHSSYTQTLN